MTRYITTVSDKKLLEKCQECVKVIRAAKETQAVKANKNATILLEELDMEKTRESKKAAAARRRERKKKKKLEKKEEKRKLHEEYKKNKIRKKTEKNQMRNAIEQMTANMRAAMKEWRVYHLLPSNNDKDTSPQRSSKTLFSQNTNLSQNTATSTKSQNNTLEKSLRHPADREDFEATGNETYVPGKGKKSYNNQYDGDTLNTSSKASNTSPKQSGKREEGWKEVVRKGQSDDSGRFLNSPFRSKKVSVSTNAISRVIGRGGSHINAIRGATGAHIEVEKQSKCQLEKPSEFETEEESDDYSEYSEAFDSEEELGISEESGKDWSDLEREAAEEDKERGDERYRDDYSSSIF
ncbi:hypothetical protein PUN28_013964 [Cardiocondyla obscurior]|uniref:K Homology domain-containing protein n=1 Tax=Cardiocondyla obscurior TaxID=286306 RepID=A0AAW2F945_9HYME